VFDPPLTYASTYEPIWSLTAATASASAVSTKSRQDFSEELYDSCLRNQGSDRRGLSSLHSTWFAVLHVVFTFTEVGRVTKEQWLGGLAGAMLSNWIECMPGSHCSRITYRRVVKLVGQAPPTRAIVARPGSLKRAAIEAETCADRPLKQRVIDLGSDIPFTCVPKMIDEGFRAQKKILAKGNQKIMEHYHVARHCLEECLGDPLCDLLLMLVLTVSSSSVTPIVAVKGHEFEAGPRKEPGIFAAGLVTRMLWFLRPDAFPWKEDHGQVLRIPEMTKKIEHKGISNRVLRELGWIEVLGKRDNPRNSEVRLRPEGELLKLRAELLRLRRDPAGFIARVFHSQESVWVERCSGIIQERP